MSHIEKIIFPDNREVIIDSRYGCPVDDADIPPKYVFRIIRFVTEISTIIDIQKVTDTHFHVTMLLKDETPVQSIVYYNTDHSFSSPEYDPTVVIPALLSKFSEYFTSKGHPLFTENATRDVLISEKSKAASRVDDIYLKNRQRQPDEEDEIEYESDRPRHKMIFPSDVIEEVNRIASGVQEPKSEPDSPDISQMEQAELADFFRPEGKTEEKELDESIRAMGLESDKSDKPLPRKLAHAPEFDDYRRLGDSPGRRYAMAHGRFTRGMPEADDRSEELRAFREKLMLDHMEKMKQRRKFIEMMETAEVPPMPPDSVIPKFVARADNLRAEISLPDLYDIITQSITEYKKKEEESKESKVSKDTDEEDILVHLYNKETDVDLKKRLLKNIIEIRSRKIVGEQSDKSTGHWTKAPDGSFLWVDEEHTPKFN